MTGVTAVSTSCGGDGILDPRCHTGVTVERDIDEEDLAKVLTAMFTYSSGRYGYVGSPEQDLQVTLRVDDSFTAGFAPEIARAFTALADLEPLEWATLQALGTSSDEDSRRQLWIEAQLPVVNPMEATDPALFVVALDDLRTTLDTFDRVRADCPDAIISTQYGLLTIRNSAGQYPDTRVGYPEASIELFVAIADRHTGVTGAARPGILELQVLDDQTRVEILQVLEDLDAAGIGPLAQDVAVSIRKAEWHGTTQRP